MGMERLIALLMAISLCLLTGCTNANTEDDSSESAGISLEANVQEKESEPDETLDTSKVIRMMEALTDYKPGSAGNSLNLYVAACGILNFSEGYDTSEEKTLRKGISDWIEAADPEVLAMVQENFSDITAAADDVLNGDEESLRLLADAGNPNEYDSYDPQRYKAVEQVLIELLEPADLLEERGLVETEDADVSALEDELCSYPLAPAEAE